MEPRNIPRVPQEIEYVDLNPKELVNSADINVVACCLVFKQVWEPVIRTVNAILPGQRGPPTATNYFGKGDQRIQNLGHVGAKVNGVEDQNER